jgi:hypothetical protein
MNEMLEEMTLKTLKPKTLKGLKRLAKDLKKLHGIQHSHALEMAAKQAGYQTFHLARQALL